MYTMYYVHVIHDNAMNVFLKIAQPLSKPVTVQFKLDYHSVYF